MKKPSSPQKPSVHFIGIGGIGVSSLAQWFLAQNWAVSGSDVAPSVITNELQKVGAQVKIGHKKAHIPDKVILCIYTKDVRSDNPEYREAMQRNHPRRRRARYVHIDRACGAHAHARWIGSDRHRRHAPP